MNVPKHLQFAFAIISQTQHVPSKQRDLYWGFFGSSGQYAGPRIAPSLPNMAAELQASSQPLLSARPATAATLCLTNHTVSTMQRLNLASTGVTSKLLTRHPHIIRPRQQFLRSESGSYLSLRKMLIKFWRTVLAEGINSVFERPNLFVSAISQPHSSRCQCDIALISLPVWSWPCC